MSLEFTRPSGKEKFQISEALWDDFKDKVEAPNSTPPDQDLPEDDAPSLDPKGSPQIPGAADQQEWHGPGKTISP